MAVSNSTSASQEVYRARRIPAVALILPLLLSVAAPIAMVAPVEAQDADPGYAPEDIWSEEYAFQIFPWGPHGNFDQLQFREYHDYFSMKERMQTLSAYYPDFLQYHEGLLGGVNAVSYTHLTLPTKRIV